MEFLFFCDIMQNGDNKMQKQIKEVFSDYKTENEIKDAEILSLNLIKKVNVLEIALRSESYIDIKELWLFEKFLKERFQFSNVDMKMQYNQNVKIKPIEKEWENLICYMIHKYPLMKPMILPLKEIRSGFFKGKKIR